MTENKFLQSIKTGFQNWSNFSSRASRTQFWLWMLFFWIMTSLISTISNLATLSNLIHKTNSLSGAEELLFRSCSFLLLIPTIAVSVRRLHDINYSGWWSLLCWNIFIGMYIDKVMTALNLRLGLSEDQVILGSILWNITAYIGIIVCIVLWCIKGNEGANSYGSPPVV